MNKLLFGLILSLGTVSGYASDLGPTDWAGSYVGFGLGYGFGDGRSNTTSSAGASVAFGGGPEAAAAMANALPSNLNTYPGGFAAGAQFGHNWQEGALVYGIEADLRSPGIKGSTDAHGSAPIIGFPFNSVTSDITKSDKLNYLATLRARLGYTQNRWMAYGTAGLAYGDVKTTISGNEKILGPTGGISTVMSDSSSSSSGRFGWVVGAGLQYALTDSWSLKGDYLYYDLGHTKTNNYFASTFLADGSLFTSANSSTSTHWNGNIVQIGADHRF